MENKVAWIACRWCHYRIDLKAAPGWYSCKCKTISIDIGKDSKYYRVIANFEDFVDIKDDND